MHVERLQRLRQVLIEARDAGKGLDMEHWTHPCGMPACAGGYAACDPVLNVEGLRLQTLAAGSRKQIAFEGKHAFEAVSAVFELSPYHTRLIFSPAGYDLGVDEHDNDIMPTFNDVIERIDALLSGRRLTTKTNGE